MFHSCRTRVVCVALVLHSCHSYLTRVRLVSLVLHWCHIRVAPVTLLSLLSGTRIVKQTRSHVRGNQMLFFDKELLKAIMTQTELRNNFLQNESEENRKLYVKQINFCVSLLRKIKTGYYEHLNKKSVIDNKLFCRILAVKGAGERDGG